MDVSHLHFGKRDQGKTADDMLKDRSNATSKAAILSALSAFDADDDERDDTYDAADAGFVVNDGHPEDGNEDQQKRKDAHEEILFRAYQSSSSTFARDAATRRGQPRARLKQETGMTDEAIEGWAVMLARSPQQLRQLEMKYSAFSGDQPTLASTAWRAGAGSGAEDSDVDGGSGSRGGGGAPRGRGRGRGRGGGRGGRGGNVAGPTGDKDTEQARRRKEASKGSRANHNRRDQRAKKMARGGLPG